MKYHFIVIAKEDRSINWIGTNAEVKIKDDEKENEIYRKHNEKQLKEFFNEFYEAHTLTKKEFDDYTQGEKEWEEKTKIENI